MSKSAIRMRHFRARKHKSGTVWYYYDLGFDHEGKRREIPLGSNYVEAVRLWAVHEGNKTPKISEADEPTFDMAVQRYIRDVIPTKALRTQKDNLAELQVLQEFFRNAPLSAIKPTHIKRYMEWRVERARKRQAENAETAKSTGSLVKAKISASPGSVRANREKALFSHIFNSARGWGMTDAPNPCAGISGYREHGRDHYIDDAVYQHIYQHASEALKLSMDLADLTGQRPSDIRKMQWRDVRDGLLWISQGKTQAKLRIRITGSLADVIDRADARRVALQARKIVCAGAIVVDDLGNPVSQGTLRGAWERARAEAAKNNPSIQKDILMSQFRDLRARAGTDTDAEKGLSAARDLLGHEEEKMTRHYVRNRAGKIVDPLDRQVRQKDI
jgi:integrase